MTSGRFALGEGILELFVCGMNLGPRVELTVRLSGEAKDEERMMSAVIALCEVNSQPLVIG